MAYCTNCGGMGQVYDALWRLVTCPSCAEPRPIEWKECSSCKGTGDGGRDSEGSALPCEFCAGAGRFRMRRDPVLLRSLIDTRSL